MGIDSTHLISSSDGGPKTEHMGLPVSLKPGNPNTPNVQRSKSSKYKTMIEDLCTQYSYNPFEAMVVVGSHQDSPPDLKFNAAKELASYLAPKQKAVDVTADVKGTHTVQIVQYGHLADAIETLTDEDE